MSDVLQSPDRADPRERPVERSDTVAASGDVMAGPKIAVIIPAYNAEKFIAAALTSVQAQSLANFEIIVVDDGSTDRTAAIVASFSDRRITLIHQHNGGVSKARNTGLAATRAPYVFFLDSDDMLAPEALRRMVDALDQAPDRVACVGNHIKISEDGTELSKRSHLRLKQLPRGDTLRHLIAKNFVCGAIAIRTEAARAAGGFDTSLKLGEDWEFWCRLALTGDFATMPDDVLLLYRQRFSSANYKLRTSPWRPDYLALDVIYANAAIRRLFPGRELKRRRRLAEIDMFWVGARNEYIQGRTGGFIKYLVLGALRYPDSIFRPRLVYLFIRGLRLPYYRARAAADPAAPEMAARKEPSRATTPRQGPTLFLLTPSENACAVETFTQSMANALRVRYPECGYDMLSVSGRWRDVPRMLDRISGAESIVFSLPLVAWKRLLLIPLVMLAAAVLLRRPVDVFLHEWSSLHWLRRLTLMPIVQAARTIVVVSPYIAKQIAGSWWLGNVQAKCRIVPHPPTIWRPQQRRLTKRVLDIREAVKDCDLVVGCFGSIYDGKASIRLLDVCYRLNRRGLRAPFIFIGSFVKSLDDYEAAFRAKAAEYGIADRVIVTGYIADTAELYTLFEEISAFLFLFPEGLTARRSSVIACLQSGRPVAVSAPHSAEEFTHHDGFVRLFQTGGLSFIPHGADPDAIADDLLAAARQPARPGPLIDTATWWNDATAATHAALRRLAGRNSATPDRASDR
jgi:glycosyltransferase involved in cell wall biosynthesis